MVASIGRAQILIGTLIDAPTPTALRIRESYICVISKNGRILHLSPCDSDQEDRVLLNHLPQEWREFPMTRLSQSQFIVPGFVDCHVHAAQYFQLGTKTNWTLFEWLDKATFPNEAKCSNLTYAHDLYTKLVKRLLRNGTTTVQYFATNHLEATKELARICGQLGQRALVGKVCADQNSPDYYVETTEGSIRDAEEFIQWCFNQEFGRKGGEMELVKPVITPRFIPTCSLPLLKALGELAAKYDVHIQSHAAETPHQVLMVHEMHPNLGAGRDVAIFDSVKLLTRKTCFAHGCHLRDEEVRHMTRVGASVAVCPYANMLHSFAVSPIPHWIDMGLSVGLGTDIAGGYNPSMPGVGRLATLADRTESFMSVHRTRPPGEEWPAPHAPSRDAWRVDWVYALHLATAGGAEALVLGDEIGKFEHGMQFDALLVDVALDGQAFEYWADEPLAEQAERWWNTGDERNLCKVWVQGRDVLH